MSGSIRRATMWALPAPPPAVQRPLLVAEKNTGAQTQVAIFKQVFSENDTSLRLQENYSSNLNDSVHRAIGPVLVVGQCFGVMPVNGVMKPNASYLHFTLLSWRLVYAIITMVAYTTMSGLSMMLMLMTAADIYRFTSMMFFGCTTLSVVQFLRLAPRWPGMLRALTAEELPLARARVHRRSLRTDFCLVCFLIMFLAAKHILSILSGYAIAQECGRGDSITESYFMNSFMQLFTFTEYAHWKAAIAQVVNISATFNWNFMDLFVIVISMALTDRFKLLNDRLDTITGKNLPEQFWRTARSEYYKLTKLVNLVDESINKIVLLSFANNLYFICLQLFNALDKGRPDEVQCGRAKDGPLWGLSHVIYFTFSFGFLLARFLTVSLRAAALHTESRRPAAVLYAVPSVSYCTEVHRFLDQVISDKVGLTGYNFFYVTRGLVLTIAGTIVTYELVLVQFNTVPPPVKANITISDSCGVPIKT